MLGDYDFDIIKLVNIQLFKCVKGQYYVLVSVYVLVFLIFILIDSCLYLDKIWIKFSEKRIF